MLNRRVEPTSGEHDARDRGEYPITYALVQPSDVDVNEIVLRPSAQR